MGTHDDLAIDLHDVEKTYGGDVRALRGIEMRVRRGEIFGLLGPNGAGKSTLVKIMMTVVRPSRASGTILGRPIGHKPTLARVGYLPEHHRLPAYLTGRQILDFNAALAKVPRGARRERAVKLLDTVGMTDWSDRKVSSYSKGMQQRIGLAAALMNDPDLVVLDEPTDGVDPVGRREIRDLLTVLKSEGRTVFLNSHLLSEIEMVCDRIAMLVKGNVVQQGALDDLTADSRRYEITIEGEAPGWAVDEASVRIEPRPTGSSTLVLRGADARSIQPIVDRLRGESRTIVSVTPVRESLEDLFMRYVTDPETGKTSRPGALSDARRRKVVVR